MASVHLRQQQADDVTTDDPRACRSGRAGCPTGAGCPRRAGSTASSSRTCRTCSATSGRRRRRPGRGRGRSPEKGAHRGLLPGNSDPRTGPEGVGRNHSVAQRHRGMSDFTLTSAGHAAIEARGSLSQCRRARVGSPAMTRRPAASGTPAWPGRGSSSIETRWSVSNFQPASRSVSAANSSTIGRWSGSSASASSSSDRAWPGRPAPN